MAPGLLLRTEPQEEYEPRPAKRVKSEAMKPEPEQDDIPSHPLGVKPSGNAYNSSINSKSFTGLFSRLPDELILQLLETFPAQHLLSLSGSCKFLYAFAHYDDLWRALFVESQPPNFEWLGTWKGTYLRKSSQELGRVSCPNVFSDALHRPFFCTYTNLNKYAQNIPRQNSIPRLSDLTFEEYTDKWTNQPFVLTDPVKSWPAYRDWNLEYLLKQYGDTPFRAEAVDWPFKRYVSYMHNSYDESPLYLFDPAFTTKMNVAAGSDGAYQPPTCFGPDLFDVLGDQRPDRRWLIIGPARSGSTFHKDPNATSAWNAPLTGSKYWLMFPSGPSIPPPPGVILSDDNSEITSPLSIAEYLLSFHAVARATPGCREGICYAGEVLHVPSGWFHLVLNLEESIALTGNFVPEGRLGQVLKFLRDTPDHVSGFKDDVTDPYGLFIERLREGGFGELSDNALDRIGEKKGKWEMVKESNGEEAGAGGFSFGFGSEDGEDEDDAA